MTILFQIFTNAKERVIAAYVLKGGWGSYSVGGYELLIVYNRSEFISSLGFIKSYY